MAAVVSCARSFPELQESTHILQQLLYHVQGVPPSYKNLPTFYSSCCIMYKEFPWVTRIYPHSTAAVVSCTRSSPELQESIHILQQLFYHIRGVQSATRIYPHSTAAVLSHTRSSKCYKNLSTFYSSCFITYEKFPVLQESTYILQVLEFNL
jgi:hypothetical protein